MTQDGLDSTPDPDDQGPLPSFDEVLNEIERGAALQPSRLRALSDPDEPALVKIMALWPKVPAERRRELLAALERLVEDDVTLDFHRIALTALRDPDTATRILAVRSLHDEERPEYMRLLLSLLRDDQAPDVRAEIANVLATYVV